MRCALLILRIRGAYSNIVLTNDYCMTQFENPSKNFNLSKNQKFAMFMFSSLTNEQKRKKIIKKKNSTHFPLMLHEV